LAYCFAIHNLEPSVCPGPWLSAKCFYQG